MSISLKNFSADFDRLVAFLPKADPNRKGDEEKAESTLFNQKLANFQSKYGSESDISALKEQLSAKKLSPKDPSTTSTKLEITAKKIESLEKILKLSPDKIEDVRAVLSPYKGNPNSELEAGDVLQRFPASGLGVEAEGMLLRLPAETLKEILNFNTPYDFGIGRSPRTLKDKQGDPIKGWNSGLPTRDRHSFPNKQGILVSANGKIIVVWTRGRSGYSLFNTEGEHIANLLDERGDPIVCHAIESSADGQTFSLTIDDPAMKRTNLQWYGICRRLYSSTNGQLIYPRDETGRPLYDHDYNRIEILADGKTFIAWGWDKIKETPIARLCSANGQLIPLRNEKGEPISPYDYKIEILADRKTIRKTIIAREQKEGKDTPITRRYGADGQFISLGNEKKEQLISPPSFDSDNPKVSTTDKQFLVSYDKQADTVRLLNRENQPIPLRNEEGQPINCSQIIVSDDEKTVVAYDKQRGTARLFSRENQLIPLRNEEGQPINCSQIIVSDDGETVVALEMGSCIVRIFATEDLFAAKEFNTKEFEQIMYEQMKRNLSADQFALIRFLEMVRKKFKIQHPGIPFSTSPIQITYNLLEAQLTSKDFTPENIEQTKALCKQAYNWVSSTLDSSKDELIPQIGTYRDYLKKAYALEEQNSPKIGGLPPHIAICIKLKKALGDAPKPGGFTRVKALFGIIGLGIAIGSGMKFLPKAFEKFGAGIRNIISTIVIFWTKKR